MTTRTVYLVGKGLTAKPPNNLPDGCKIAALNGAVKLCEHVDFLFVNDLDSFAEITAESLKRVALLVVPTELHLCHGRHTTPTAAELPACAPPAVFYQLPTAQQKTSAPSFGRVLSVGESAVAWLIYRGYREFITSGVDEFPLYSPEFNGGTQCLSKPKTWYRENVERIKKRIETVGGTWERM